MFHLLHSCHFSLSSAFPSTKQAGISRSAQSRFCQPGGAQRCHSTATFKGADVPPFCFPFSSQRCLPFELPNPRMTGNVRGRQLEQLCNLKRDFAKQQRWDFRCGTKPTGRCHSFPGEGTHGQTRRPESGAAQLRAPGGGGEERGKKAKAA